MPPAHRLAALLGGLVLMALAVTAFVASRAGAAPVAAPAPTEAPAPVPIAATGQAPVPTTAPPPKGEPSRLLELPDGTFVPALNGATDAPSLREYWGAEVPWSPIVGVERNNLGVEWYRHANGSYSTTQMVYRSDLQRDVAMTRVGHPGPEVTPPVGK